MIDCPCGETGKPYCGSCTRSEYDLACLERSLVPRTAAEEQPEAEEEPADG